ncbi:MAG: hypothetical protein LBD84_03330 [Campylobacteraceae bacterium]|jgi:hypothetical protein|nr:hypothetical protein [Campylobacteraceae bacterium]
MYDKKIPQTNNSDILKRENFNEKITFEKDGIEKKPESLFDKKLKITGILFIVAICIISFMSKSSPEIDTSDSAMDALKSGHSTSLLAGAVILARDGYISSKDYTITHSNDQKKSKIWVWDYAAEDGDYVQIIVDGSPIADAFFIKNKPVVFTVPSDSIVQVKGIRDGGGGITYAIRYELNGITYFNNAPINGFNTYTLIKQ